MSLTTFLQQGDIGVTLKVIIYQQDGVTPQNISSATALNIYIYRPDGSILTVSANFLTNGTDGSIYYTTQTNDLSIPGIYNLQGSYSVNSNIFYSNLDPFIVQPPVA